jgi:hypothetical protein
LIADSLCRDEYRQEIFQFVVFLQIKYFPAGFVFFFEDFLQLPKKILIFALGKLAHS